MKLNSYCMCCLVNKQEENIRRFTDPEKKLTYMKEVFRRMAEASDTDCAPNISIELKEKFSQFWQTPMKDYTEIKKEYNQLVLDLLPELREELRKAPDPLMMALIYSRTGNYIDFNAIANVNQETALSMLKDEKKESLDQTEYHHFLSDLANAKELVYVTDNCGEVALDRLVIEVLKEQYPSLHITVIVRGMDSANDATMDDARMCGLTELTDVIGNGSRVGGTWLEDVNTETLQLLHNADLIISKGQGNFETLHECGLNIYYLFLCKCARFVDLFQAEYLQGMFVNENRIHPASV